MWFVVCDRVALIFMFISGGSCVFAFDCLHLCEKMSLQDLEILLGVLFT